MSLPKAARSPISALTEQISQSRREFLRHTAICALPFTLLALGIRPAAAFVSQLVPKVGSGAVNVRDKGALGDGHRDDTASLQAAIDALPAEGGTVHVPAGNYLIDTKHPLRLRNRTHLQLAADATLTALPSDRPRYYIVLLDGVTDVEISGGRIVGERDHHLGSTGEWGYGIFVRGASQVLIRDIQISKCWGDGICVGAIVGRGISTQYSSHVELSRVVCTENRRQGLTLGPVRHVRVVDSEFSNTAGTSPACGIDIEPDKPDTAQDIRIERCVMRGNRGCGIQIYRNVSQVTLQGCTIQGNAGYGVLLDGASGSVVTQNTISDSGMTGAMLRGGTSDCRIEGNTFGNNATRTIRAALKNLQQMSLKGATGDGRDIHVMGDTHAIGVSNNKFNG
jgi:parallel beta-helix repeat protein